MSQSRTRVAFALSFLLACAGCHSAKVAEPLTAKLGGNDPDAQMEFWHTLATRNLTSNDEAFHGLLLYIDGQDPATAYNGRVNALKSRALLDASFNQPAPGHIANPEAKPTTRPVTRPTVQPTVQSELNK